MEQALFWIALCVTSALPIDQIVPWVYQHLRQTRAQLDVPQQPIRFSKATLTVGLIWFLEGIKGWGLLMLLTRVLGQDTAIISIGLALILVLHTWSPFTGFKTNVRWPGILWGVYIFASPLGILFLPLYIMLSFLTNRFSIGLLFTQLLLWALLTLTDTLVPLDHQSHFFALSIVLLSVFLSYHNPKDQVTLYFKLRHR